MKVPQRPSSQDDDTLPSLTSQSHTSTSLPFIKGLYPWLRGKVLKPNIVQQQEPELRSKNTSHQQVIYRLLSHLAGHKGGNRDDDQDPDKLIEQARLHSPLLLDKPNSLLDIRGTPLNMQFFHNIQAPKGIELEGSAYNAQVAVLI